MTSPIPEAGPTHAARPAGLPADQGAAALRPRAQRADQRAGRASPTRSATASRSCWSRRRGRSTTARRAARGARADRPTMSAEPLAARDAGRPGRKALEIEFDDGAAFSYPAELLRVESPSAEVQGHGPGQKVIVAGRAPGRHHGAGAGRQLRRADHVRRRAQHRHLLLALPLPSRPRPGADLAAYLDALEAQGLSRDP